MMTWAACLLALTTTIGSATDEEPPAFLPAGAHARVHVPRGTALWDSPFGVLVNSALAAVPDLQSLRTHIEQGAGRSLGALARDLMGGELELGFYRTTNRPKKVQLVVASRADEARTLRESFDAVLGFLIAADVKLRKGSYRDVKYRRIERKALARLGDVAFFSSHDSLLADAIDRHLDQPPSDERSPAPPTDTLLEFDVAIDAAEDGESQLLARASRKLGRRLKAPVAAILLGEMGRAADAGDRVQGTVTADGERLLVRAELPYDPALVPLQVPAPFETAASIPVSAETLAVLYLERDLADWWRHREVTMPEDVQTKLARFDTDVGMLFGGRSLAEDVFGHLGPRLAIVFDRQTFEAATVVPAVRLPGACLVARVDDPARFGPTLQVAFQSLLGLVNVDRAQAGLAPFLTNTERRGDALFCTASILIGPEDAPRHPAAEHNLSPALALVDDWLLLGTSTEQVERLARSIANLRFREERGSLALHLDVSGLVQLGRDNRTALVAQNIIEEGHSPEEAEREIDTLLSLLASLDVLDLRLFPGDGDRLAATLEVLPAGDAP